MARTTTVAAASTLNSGQSRSAAWITVCVGSSYQKTVRKPSSAQPLKVNLEVVSRKLVITNRGTMLPPRADMISTTIVPKPLTWAGREVDDGFRLTDPRGSLFCVSELLDQGAEECLSW